MHEPSGVPRVDLNPIKDRLKLVLKDQASHYWELLRKFVQAKLSKKEFDYLAKGILGEDHVPLHNLLIRSILSNARCAFPPVVSQTAVRQHKGKGKIPLVKESAVNNNATPLPPTAGGNKKISAKKKGVTATGAQKTGTAGPVKAPPKGKPSAAPRRPITKEIPLGPEYTVLRQRMQRVATEAGLAGLTQDSIRVMMTAVETYAKRIMHSSKPLHRPHPSLPDNTRDPIYPSYPSSSTITYTTKCIPIFPSMPATHPPFHTLPPHALPPSAPPTPNLLSTSASGLTNTLSSSIPPPRFNTITLQDLHKTSILHPSLFGEDFLVNQERVAVSLM